MENALKIFIAEDHESMAESLMLQLKDSPEFEVIGLAKTAQDVYHSLKYLELDILILDLILPFNNIKQYAKPLGYEILDFIRANDLNIQVIVISSHEEPSFMIKARSKGAMGYLTKKVTKAELIKALKIVGFEKREYFEKKTYSRLISDLNSNGIVLTQKEMYILNHIAKGMTNKKMAELLCLSSETINDYRDGLMRKFEAKNSGDLIQIATKHGYLKQIE